MINDFYEIATTFIIDAGEKVADGISTSLRVLVDVDAPNALEAEFANDAH